MIEGSKQLPGSVVALSLILGLFAALAVATIPMMYAVAQTSGVVVAAGLVCCGILFTSSSVGIWRRERWGWWLTLVVISSMLAVSSLGLVIVLPRSIFELYLKVWNAGVLGMGYGGLAFLLNRDSVREACFGGSHGPLPWLGWVSRSIAIIGIVLFILGLAGAFVVEGSAPS